MSPSGLHFNRPLLITIIGVFIILAVVYKYSDNLGLTHKADIDDSKMAGIKTGDVRQEFDIPENILSKAKSLKVVESTVDVPFKGKNVKIFLRKPETDVSSKISVLLLHGQKFSSLNWAQIGTIQFLAALGFNSVAVDLPDYGNSDKGKIAPENRGEFLDALIKTLHLESPIIVSPSMSGSFSLPYLFEGDLATISKRASGFVPIAPVSTNLYKERYSSTEIKTLIIRGSKDETLGPESEEYLKALPKNLIYVIPEAGHACYLDNTDYFHKILFSFLQNFKN